MVQPTTHADAPPEIKSEPLMIELQGNRYVRLEGMQQSPRETNAPSSALTPHPVRPELPPTVLIFRDGHREQVARIRDRGKHDLRQWRLLAERPLDEEHRSLRAQHPCDHPGESRGRHPLHPAFRSERSRYQTVVFLPYCFPSLRGPETATFSALNMI